MGRGQAYLNAPGFGQPLSFEGTIAAAVGVAVSVGASPFLYQAPCEGELAFSSGTVSAVAIIDAAGATVTVASATGGHVHVSDRWKGVQFTYSGTILPVLTFVPD